MAKGLKKKPAPAKKKKGGSTAVKACKAALATGAVGTYGDLLKTRGDGTADRDHIPSYKSGEKRATALAGRKLTKAEKSRVKRRMRAIVLPKSIHRAGRTYGGKNTDVQTTADASDLRQAALDDIAAYQALGTVDAATIQTMTAMVATNAAYDTMLLDAVNDN